MSVSVWLSDPETGRAHGGSVAWLNNPFGLSKWLAANTDSHLIDFIKQHVMARRHTRTEIVREASRTWQMVNALEKGVFHMPLDWSWMAPARNVPCLWSLADGWPPLWEKMNPVASFEKRRRAGERYKPYKQSPNVTVMQIGMQDFMEAIPPPQRPYFKQMTLEDYKAWTLKLVQIGLGYSDPTTILKYEE